MKKLLICALLGFIAIVDIPMGPTKTYKNVKKVEIISEMVYLLVLENGKRVYVPSQWTLIEEQ